MRIIFHMRQSLFVFLTAYEEQVIWIQFQGGTDPQSNEESAIPEGLDTAFKALVLLQLNPAPVRYLNLG